MTPDEVVKVLKAEIEKILEELYEKGFILGKTTELTLFENARLNIKANKLATSSLTSLIIKWLESRKITLKKLKSKPCPYSKIDCCTMQDYSRNQLITELIGEVK